MSFLLFSSISAVWQNFHALIFNACFPQDSVRFLNVLPEILETALVLMHLCDHAVSRKSDMAFRLSFFIIHLCYFSLQMQRYYLYGHQQTHGLNTHTQPNCSLSFQVDLLGSTHDILSCPLERLELAQLLLNSVFPLQIQNKKTQQVYYLTCPVNMS